MSLLLAGLGQAALKTPTDLTCEFVRNPAVVDVSQPRLAWINEAQEGDRGQSQTGYHIRVASQKGRLADPDLWDSGKIDSPQSTRVVYRGNGLNSRQRRWWQVRVWDKPRR